ncbi:response regulator transcription factor [Maribellus maritimus]|uniref:response regulator transcription factor n=1 Tax=Maribellus maritimus TaxID=2870838 RepID=UPI001EEA75D2|nr:LuxR C-terminal-related transcriptional regulator [Maribellus maritimus]MCG6186275.1 LuxR C-terminal-related transcriptional regulator [Maribellus maritimus]
MTVIIAVSQVLTRLGIKTFLSVIGIEPEYKELAHLDELDSVIPPGSKSYLIIEQSLLVKPESEYLLNIAKKYSKSKILIIGNRVIKNCPCSHFVLNSDNRQEILEKFQDFFSEKDDTSTVNGAEDILSDRETEVLKEVAKGLANKEIADKLYISINTVITHRKNITEKLGVKTVSALTVYALMNKLITPEEAIK